MPRAMLRDDYAGYYAPGSGGVRLDDDVRSAGKAVLSPTVDETVPGATVPGVSTNPLVTVRERFGTGYDDDGNVMWSWADVISEKAAISFEESEEVSDAGNTVLQKATLLVLYPYGEPAIRESASVLTNDGRRWSITSIERMPDRLQLKVERIDDAS